MAPGTAWREDLMNRMVILWFFCKTNESNDHEHLESQVSIFNDIHSILLANCSNQHWVFNLLDSSFLIYCCEMLFHHPPEVFFYRFYCKSRSWHWQAILLMDEIPFPTTWDGAETLNKWDKLNYQPQLVQPPEFEWTINRHLSPDAKLLLHCRQCLW